MQAHLQICSPSINAHNASEMMGRAKTRAAGWCHVSESHGLDGGRGWCTWRRSGRILPDLDARTTWEVFVGQ